jgi:hypothetical protein
MVHQKEREMREEYGEKMFNAKGSQWAQRAHATYDDESKTSFLLRDSKAQRRSVAQRNQKVY